MNGLYGEWLAKFDIKVTYTWLGIAVAKGLYQHPVCGSYRAAGAGRVGSEYEEAAETLGATRWQSFRWVRVLPELSPALMAGVALSFTRSLGELARRILSPGTSPGKLKSPR